MEHFPLCGKNATVVLPEWSGGKYFIKCAACGEYSTNKITVDELDSLRAAGSSRINELQYSIEIAEQPWDITKSQRLGIIVLESGLSKEMTKKEKKHRRRTDRAPSDTSINFFSKSDEDPNT